MTDDIKSDLQQHHQSSIMDALMLIKSNDDEVTASTITNESMNSVSSNKTFNSLVQMFKKLEQKVDNLNTQQPVPIPPVPAPPNPNNRRYNSTTDLFNPRTGKPWKRYCWSHGYTTHNGRNCPNPKPGHITNANFQNRQGGRIKIVVTIEDRETQDIICF